jgi:UDP-N-acetylmuramoyl-L-alanyl-D-glutamate--2,6-diaminopimelate ligase
MNQPDRKDRLMGFESLGLLAGGRRAGDWSRPMPEITGLSVDSRDTREGHLFAAMPGVRFHGAEFAPYALRMGAAAILTDGRGAEIAESLAGPLEVPVVVHDDARRALALAAARWYARQPEVMVAVTGTNGKTSVASFTRQIWEAAGEPAVNFGTVGVEGALARPLAHTTPEPITLHALLADLADHGITHGAMEASSHGLEQRRLDGVHLAAAAFTNISRDHLDYHPDFDAYLAAKRGLFARVLPRGGTGGDQPRRRACRGVPGGRRGAGAPGADRGRGAGGRPAHRRAAVRR